MPLARQKGCITVGCEWHRSKPRQCRKWHQSALIAEMHPMTLIDHRAITPVGPALNAMHPSAIGDNSLAGGVFVAIHVSNLILLIMVRKIRKWLEWLEND